MRHSTCSNDLRCGRDLEQCRDYGPIQWGQGIKSKTYHPQDNSGRKDEERSGESSFSNKMIVPPQQRKVLEMKPTRTVQESLGDFTCLGRWKTYVLSCVFPELGHFEPLRSNLTEAQFPLSSLRLPSSATISSYSLFEKLTHVCVHVCTCVHSCVRVCVQFVCMYGCASSYVEVWDWLQVSTSLSSYIWRQSLSLSLELTNSTRLPGQKSQRSPGELWNCGTCGCAQRLA